MPVSFPAITPVDMEFTPPEFPVGEDVSLGGVSILRRYGNRAAEGKLSMQFENISDDVAAQIVTAHAQCKGTDSLTIPPAVFYGASASLLPYLNANAYPGLTWHFVQGSPPRVRRVQGGGSLSSVSVELRARLGYG